MLCKAIVTSLFVTVARAPGYATLRVIWAPASCIALDGRATTRIIAPSEHPGPLLDPESNSGPHKG